MAEPNLPTPFWVLTYLINPNILMDLFAYANKSLNKSIYYPGIFSCGDLIL